IPYVTPPVGNLRFKAPRVLVTQNTSVQDESQDFDGMTASYVGVNASPGVEDCLKLWIWAPAGAKEGDNLAVQVYTHSGGYQNSQSPKNAFSDEPFDGFCFCGKSLIDQLVRLYRNGKLAPVPVIGTPISPSADLYHSSRPCHGRDRTPRAAQLERHFDFGLDHRHQNHARTASALRENLPRRDIPGASYPYDTNTLQGLSSVHLFVVNCLWTLSR
ncbi:hypothetical protein B0H17DRAFT_948886, partial [Mycena rosella]